MGAVILKRSDVNEDRIPNLCICCGKPATARPTKTFSKRQEWTNTMLFLGGVPYFACAALFRNYATMSTPLCDSHRNHFRWQSAIFWGGLAIIATLLIGCFAMIPHMPDKILQNCFAGTGIFALLWVIAYVINNFVSVTAAKVDDHEILLVGVADRFANACNRRSSDYVDEVEEASHFQFARR